MMGSEVNRVQFGPFEADFRTQELRRDGVRQRLSGQPFQVLEVLLERPGELITREELRSRIWHDDTFVDFSHGLNSAVNKLREALCDSAQEPKYVETLPRRGYRFIAEIKVVPEDLAVVQQETAPPMTRASEAPVQFIASKPQSRKRPLYFMVVAALSILAFVGYRIGRSGSESRAQATSVSQRVLPLTNILDPTAFPSFSSDGRYAAFYRDGRTPESSGIYVSQLGTDQLTQVTKSSRDSFPVWSPDNKFVAFTRSDELKHISIFIVPAGLDGGSRGEPKIVSTGSIPVKRWEIDWSPDGEHIAFDGGAGIFMVSVKDSKVKRITEVGPLEEDWGPAFSDDGKRLLFVRSGQTTMPDQLRIVPIEGGESVLVLSDLGKMEGRPQWSSDGESVVFASQHNGAAVLWKVSANERDKPMQYSFAGWNPAVSRRAHHLAYMRPAHGLNVWSLDLTRIPPMPARVLIPSVSQTDQGPGPQFSPDGKKIAFMADRSGTMEIWTADADGNNENQLTAVGNAGTPRWSPDGRSIAFDSGGREVPMIYVVSLNGGAPRPLTEDVHDKGGQCPSWSRDGRWIYFSGRGQQVWKVPAQGGTPVQVTREGGHTGFESPDGKYFYYAKTFYSNPSIWQVPVNGGKETMVSPEIRPSSWASWSVVEKGIIFAGSASDGRPVVSFYDFETHKVKKLATLDIAPFWLTSTYDGKTVAFDKQGWLQPQVMLVENFR